MIDSAMTTWTMFNEAESIVRDCAILSEQTGCAVVLVDQFGTTSTNRNTRELSGMLGDVDFAVEVTDTGLTGRQWQVTAARETASGERRSFALRPIKISENNFGHQATACMVDDHGVIRNIDEILDDAQSTS